MLLLFTPNVILIAAAVIPAVALLAMVYRQDRVEKEPAQLLGALIVQGILAAAIAKVAERLGMMAVNAVAPSGMLNAALMYFGVVAYAEEGAKYALLKRRTWNAPEFNCRFDAVVYAVFVSLGFALWENIGYVLSYGFHTALVRAVTAVPGHACFGVFMGCWYGQAYTWHRGGNASASRTCRVLAVVLPALLHGAYDFLADAMSYGSAWYFIAFVLVLFIATYRLLHRLSNADGYIRKRFQR